MPLKMRTPRSPVPRTVPEVVSTRFMSAPMAPAPVVATVAAPATPARKPRRSRGRAHGNIGLIVMNPSPFAAPPGRRFPSSEFIAELDVALARRREHGDVDAIGAAQLVSADLAVEIEQVGHGERIGRAHV